MRCGSHWGYGSEVKMPACVGIRQGFLFVGSLHWSGGSRQGICSHSSRAILTLTVGWLHKAGQEKFPEVRPLAVFRTVLCCCSQWLPLPSNQKARLLQKWQGIHPLPFCERIILPLMATPRPSQWKRTRSFVTCMGPIGIKRWAWWGSAVQSQLVQWVWLRVIPGASASPHSAFVHIEIRHTPWLGPSPLVCGLASGSQTGFQSLFISSAGCLCVQWLTYTTVLGYLIQPLLLGELSTLFSLSEPWLPYL